MSKHAYTLALGAALCTAALSGCHNNSKPAPGAVAVRLANGSIQVIPAGQPIPVGATVVASGSSAAAATPAAPAPVAPVSTPADGPVAPSAASAAAAPPVPEQSASTASVKDAPAPRPALVVPSGTHVSIRTTETLSAQRSEVGSPFSGVLNAPVVVHRTTAFARGTSVRGEVTSAKGRGRFKGAGVLGITLREIGGYRVESSEYVASEKGRGKRTAGFIGGGGGIGALIGGLAGGGKGALIGGLSGAGAGTAAGALTGGRDVVIPSESAVSFTLESPIRLK